MHLLQNIPLLAGLAAALSIPPHQLQRRDPTANDIKVAELSFAGAGCGASTAGLNASVVDAATFRVPRIIFAAKAGEAGAKVVETKSNCQLTLRVTHPAGWQFSVAKADYYGRVHLPQGSEATSISTYSFSGVTNKVYNSVLLYPFTQIRGIEFLRKERKKRKREMLTMFGGRNDFS